MKKYKNVKEVAERLRTLEQCKEDTYKAYGLPYGAEKIELNVSVVKEIHGLLGELESYLEEMPIVYMDGK